MPSSPNWPKPGSLSATDTWRLRRRTLEAMAALAAARARVAFIPLEHWRGQLGLPGDASDEQLAESRRIARHVDRAAERLPFDFKCLPRAIALAAMLRRRIEKMACDFPIQTNYFAWQAFSRHYDTVNRQGVPPYLKADIFALIRDRTDRVDVNHVIMTDFLADKPENSFDRWWPLRVDPERDCEAPVTAR